MFINITDSAKADNKGSSRGLVHYLEKENRVSDRELPEYWFNGKNQDIQSYEVRHAIDGNLAKLGRGDAKFFLINISPSQKELKYLMDEYGGVDIKDQLKAFAEKVMDEYAKNFRRDTISSSKDLLWFGKLEHHRYYSHRDAEVKNGEKKRGEPKDGEQLHIQIIVGRKDMTNRIKLSPMNNSRGKNSEHSKKLGQFNRMAFKQSGENLFDEMFGFQRKLKETLAFANIQKNGTLAQKEQLDILKRGASQHVISSSLVIELAREISAGSFKSATEMLEGAGKTTSGFIELMMEPTHQEGIFSDPIGRDEKRRRKKLRQRGQGFGL